MNTQIFGWTQPETAAPDEYVKFLMAFTNGDGDIVIQIRNELGRINEVVLPRLNAVDLSSALSAHTI